jgi:uncharacterized protein YbcI
MHLITDSGPKRQPLTGGELNAAIARSAVRVHSRFVGRGPTKAQAFFRHEFVVVVMQGAMTRSERNLAGGGSAEAVRELRRELQETMRPALVSRVEEATGRKVVAFLNDNHVDPDVSVEVFVLDQPVPVADAGPRAVD